MRSSKFRTVRTAVPAGAGSSQSAPVNGNVLPPELQAVVVDDTHVRFNLQSSTGVNSYTMEFTAPPAPNPNTAPALRSSIDQFREGGTNDLVYIDVPYGTAEWLEPTTGEQAKQVFEIYLPSTVAPAGGYPWFVYCHPNGKNHRVGPTSDPTQYANLVEPLLQKGFIVFSVEFRHPVPNANWDGTNTVPHDDLFDALQGIRNFHQAFNMNLEHGFGYGRSRGNLLLWTAAQPNRANPQDPVYKKRLSTKLLGYWGVNAQATYSTFEAIETYIIPGDQAAAKAANPDNPAWQSLYQYLLTSSASELPATVIQHDTPYFSPSEFVSVANITKVTLAQGGDMLHHPDYGIAILQGYKAAGAKEKIVVADDISGSANTLADMGAWAEKIIAGVPCDDAYLQTRARRLNAPYWHMVNPMAGAYAGPATPSPVTTVGSEWGVLTDASYGAANRNLGAVAQGVFIGITSADRRPTTELLPNGEIVMKFDGTNDRLTAEYASSGAPYVVSFTDTGEDSTLVASTTALFSIGVPSLANRKVALILAAQSKEQGLYRAARQKAARIFGTF